jgi:CHAD domain-containing protein
MLAAVKRQIRQMTAIKVCQPTAFFQGIGRRACRLIGGRLKTMLAYEPYVHQPEQENALHGLRIAAKHLRYTMEYFEPFFNGEMKGYIQDAREIQRLLGEFHDCVVWMEFLPAFLEEEHRRAMVFFGKDPERETIKRGVDYLLAERRGRRQQVYKTFLARWKEMKRDRVWENLITRLRKQKINTKLTIEYPG